MATKTRLTDKDIKQLIKDVPMEATPHSVRGISVTTKFVKRDATTGRFVVIKSGSSKGK